MIFFMKKALIEAEKALVEKEFPVGCIITYQDKIVAKGKRTGSNSKRPSETDHAEINTIRELNKLHPDLPRNEMTIYSTMEPCLMCLSAIIFSGFPKIVFAYEDVMGGGCTISKKNLPPIYQENYPEIKGGILRKESLSLFKSFFQLESNRYWKGSLLEKYTMNL